jgi:hypothetical protein
MRKNDMRVYSPEKAREMILAGTAPDNMTVKGNLDLYNSKELTRLPKGLRVKGDLHLNKCTALKKLPDGLSVQRNLNLGGCKTLTELPDDFKVGGWISLALCEALTHLPDDLNVGSWLNLTGCTALTQLSDGLSVKGNLYLPWGTLLTHLPDGLSVGGNLYLTGCIALTHLPDGLYVGGWIHLNHPLHIPNTVECKGFKFGDIFNFPREYINNPQLIKVADVINEQNAQKRSVLLELMGIQRFMREANSTIIYQDVEVSGNVRQLLRVELPTAKDRFGADVREEPIVMLSVTCPSTANHYMLRVPPDMQNCHQAAAWVAGFDDPERYQPVLET